MVEMTGPGDDPFERLFHAQFPRLQRYLDRLSGDGELARDLAQESFLRLFRRRGFPDRPEAWLITVATNLWRNARAARGRQRRLLGPARAPELVGDPSPSPAHATLAAEAGVRVRAALAQLPGLLGACESAPIQLPDPRWPDADALLGRQGLVAARLCPLQSAELRAIVAVGSADPRFQDYGAALLQAVLPQWLVALTLAVSMARLSASEDRFHTLADTLPRGLLATDEDDHITYANAAASQLLATPQLVGRRLEEVLPRGVGPTLARGDRVIDVGLRRYADHLGRQHTTVVLTDASEQHRRERDLRDAATHDGLTGLLNRRGLELEAARLLTELAQRGAPAVVMVLDLDRFKAVNDAQGHPAGDRLLRRVAAELRRGLRTTDLLARPGGDEFVMLCPDARPESAATLGRTVRAAVQRAAAAEGADVDASVGVACFPGHGVDAGALIARADAAMYAAKRAGGASVQGAEAVAGASTTSSR